jgi:NADP-dependent 3-hydroxy acid dehydrogenase YdfG
MLNSRDQLCIVITGASSGLGEAIALEMAKDGHVFYLTARRREKLKLVAQNVESLGGKAYFGDGDVGNEGDVDRLFDEAIENLGTIDVMFANAGVGYFGNLEDMTIEQYDAQFNTNVRGVFLWLRKVLPIMKKRNSGQIIVTSSNLGLETSSKASIYSSTKHAVQAMVWCLREELKGTRIKAATINPGSISTPWYDGKQSDRSKMLTAKDISKTVRFIIEQSETSNIDHILLRPGRT